MLVAEFLRTRAAHINGEDGELGCSKSLVGLVVPTGYTFNTDGSSLLHDSRALCSWLRLPTRTSPSDNS